LKYLKNIRAFFLAIVILLTSVGVSISSHLCHSKGTSEKTIGALSKCCKKHAEVPFCDPGSESILVSVCCEFSSEYVSATFQIPIPEKLPFFQNPLLYASHSYFASFSIGFLSISQRNQVFSETLDKQKKTPYFILFSNLLV
jgi:hypothetical protein